MTDPRMQDTGNPQSPDLKRARLLKILIAAVLGIALCFSLYNVLQVFLSDRQIPRPSARQWIDLERGSGNPLLSVNPPGKPEFRIAIAPIVSPEKSLEMYEGFVQYIAKRLDRRAVSLYRRTYSETNDLVRYQRCDLAIVCTYPFLRGEREFGMQALVVPQINGETTCQSFIIVPRSSPATSIFGLRGKRFASADIISTTGWLFPAMLLMDAGENPNRYFGEHLLTGSHDRSLQAVLDGFVDGAAVHGIAYQQLISENPSIAKRIKVIAKSPPFGIPPVVVHPQMDRALREEVLNLLLSMDKDAEGKQILTKLQIEKFVPPGEMLFASVKSAVSRLEGWR
jgi:phosphonate transport system substrate-binding protein